MTTPGHIVRGARELQRLLRERAFDLRGLDRAGFRRWLDALLPGWQRDPAFAQRVRIRDLRRAHPELRALEKEHRRAEAADAATPEGARLRRLEEELRDTGKAVAGLTAALTSAAPDKRAALEEKRTAFQARLLDLQREQARLTASSPERLALLRAGEALGRLRAALGLDREEECLDQLQRQRGRRSGHAGEAFERLARTLTETVLVPELLRRGKGAAARPVRVLEGVTLGAARTELDQVVIRQAPAGKAVEVLAVIEAKRNINDLAHGFRLRQENLAWLTGDTGRYDAAVYRTGHFSTGHFDRAAVHEQGGETFVFAPGSFRRFRREPGSGLFLRRLYFITRAGMLWGLSSAALARVSFRVATDERWDPDDETYLDGLLGWCRSLAEPLEAADVIRLYAQAAGHARNILVAE